MNKNIEVGKPLPIRVPRLPPHKAIGDYLLSKSYLKDIHIKGLDWDKPGHDPVYQLLSCQRMLQHRETVLLNKREWEKKEKFKLQKQWNDLYQDELELKKSFNNMAKFLKSNYDKRERAMLNLHENRKLVKERTEDIDELKRKIACIVKNKKEMDVEVSNLRIYEHYLRDVLDETRITSNIDDLITRYESLLNVRNTLGNRQSNSLEELEKAKNRMAKIAEEHQLNMLGFNNIAADLRSRFATASREALHWESLVLDIRRRAFEKYQEISEVKQSCWNTYLLMCKRKNILPKIKENDIEHQLMFIKKTLQELKQVKGIIDRKTRNITKYQKLAKKNDLL